MNIPVPWRKSCETETPVDEAVRIRGEIGNLGEVVVRRVPTLMGADADLLVIRSDNAGRFIVTTQVDETTPLTANLEFDFATRYMGPMTGSTTSEYTNAVLQAAFTDKFGPADPYARSVGSWRNFSY